jgi:NADH:ubiquinone reductase (H+-translocating)
MEEGIHLRNHILRCFERAVQETDPARRRELLTFVVVGGGPTGVEYVGALSELVHGPTGERLSRYRRL